MVKQTNITVLGLERTFKAPAGRRSLFIASCDGFKSGNLVLGDALADLNHFLTSVNAGFKVKAKITKYDFHLTRVYQ